MGKHKYIETPEKLHKLFEAYKKHIKAHPIKKMDFKGKDAEKVYYELEKPLTMEGFENYVAKNGLNQAGLAHYFANTNEKYNDYLTICSYVRREIREDQISGGMAGIYNPSITQRLNNLVDKQDQNITGNQTIKISFKD